MFYQVLTCTTSLRRFDESDLSRSLRWTAINNLEAYTYRARELLESAEFISALGADSKPKLAEMVEQSSKWIQSTEASAASKADLKERLSALEKLVEPADGRRIEAAERPERIAQFKSALEHTRVVLDEIKKGRRAAAKEKPSTMASASASATAWAWGMGPDGKQTSTSTSTSTSSSSRNTLAAYSEEDETQIEKAAEKADQWLSDNLAKQSKLQAHESPAFSGQDMEGALKELNQAMLDVVNRRIKMVSQAKARSKKANESSSSSGGGDSPSDGGSTARATARAQATLSVKDEL